MQIFVWIVEDTFFSVMFGQNLLYPFSLLTFFLTKQVNNGLSDNKGPTELLWKWTLVLFMFGDQREWLHWQVCQGSFPCIALSIRQV